MIVHGIEVPSASRKMFHHDIDAIALGFNKAYRQQSGINALALNIDLFVDWLEISTEWDRFDEPIETSCFARIDLNDCDELIQINENYQDLFESRPDVYRTCLGHEVGHIVLKHIEHITKAETPSLFGNLKPDEPSFLHKSDWAQYGLTSAEVRQRQQALRIAQDKLVKSALTNPRAYQALNSLDDKFEPEWMFWQAEQFARCLAIPSDKLQEILESEPLVAGWRPIGDLAKIFEVSLGTMKTRLAKLKMIELDSKGVPIPVVKTLDSSLLF